MYLVMNEVLTASSSSFPCLGACFSFRKALISTWRTRSLVTCNRPLGVILVHARSTLLHPGVQHTAGQLAGSLVADHS